MSEQDKEQQTEEATPRKLDKLREDGKVAKSQDLAGAAVIVSSALALTFFGGHGARALTELSERCFRLERSHQPLQALEAVIPVLTTTVLPVVATAGLMAAAAGLAQTRGLFSVKALAFKPERMDPSSNLKNILPGKQSMEELLKQLLKIVALGFVVWRVVADATPEFAVLPASAPLSAAATVGRVATRVALYGGIAFAGVAAIDYWHARKRFDEEAKMSKHDIKQERKESEGSPELKAHRQRRMREIAKQAALGGVKAATVLVVNPTHYACALRYEADRDPAPMLLAKGVEEVALAMRTEARKHGVPIVENRGLARALWADGTVGRTIPTELYQIAAGVIAHVLRLRGAVK